MARLEMPEDRILRLAGDCRDVLPGLPKRKIRAIITSPPFYGCGAYLPQFHPDAGQEIGGEATPAEYADKLVDIFRMARPCLTEDGVLWLAVGEVQREDDSIAAAAFRVAYGLRQDGWIQVDSGVWDDGNTQRPVDRVFLFAKTSEGAHRVRMPEPKRWNMPADLVDEAVFYSLPAKMVGDLIAASTKPEDIILDPFAGVGNVGLMARSMERKAVLIETDPRQDWVGDRHLAQ